MSKTLLNSSLMGNLVYGGSSVTFCAPNDTSFFCTLSRVFNEIYMIVILAILGYVGYNYLIKKGKK